LRLRLRHLLHAGLLNVSPRNDSPVSLRLRLLLRHSLPVCCRLELLRWLNLLLLLLRLRLLRLRLRRHGRILPDHWLSVCVLDRRKLRNSLPRNYLSRNHLLWDRLAIWHSVSCGGPRNH
jgi:hypothetical protein